MKFGISIQSNGANGHPDHLALISRRAEKLGFNAAVLGDHIIFPDSIASDYPYSASGSFASAESGECLTYVEFNQLTTHIAHGLIGLGVGDK